jgi:hypothetical protein
MSAAFELELAATAHGDAMKELTERPMDGNLENIEAVERVAHAILTVCGELRRLA